MGTTESTGDRADRVHRAGVSATAADRAEWGAFLSSHRDRLRRMVALRLDQRLRGRIDPSDVIQEAFLEATERAPGIRAPVGSDAVVLVAQVLDPPAVAAYSSPPARHPSRETPAARCRFTAALFPAATSAALAAQLLGHDTRRAKRPFVPRKATASRGARPHGPDRSGSARLAPLRAALQR